MSHADGLIVWTDIRDGRTGQTVPDMVFRESDYDRAIERTREQLRQMRLKYVIRVLLSIREDTGISDKEVVASASDVLLMVAAATGGFWLWGFEGMTLGVLGVFFGGALFWTMYHRRVYSPWLHPPRDQHGGEAQCRFHDRRYSFLPINWWRARYS